MQVLLLLLGHWFLVMHQHQWHCGGCMGWKEQWWHNGIVPTSKADVVLVLCSVTCTHVGVRMTGERGQGRWALVGVESDQDSCRQEQATATVQWGWLATALSLFVEKMHCIAFFIGFFRHAMHFPRHKWWHKCKAHPFLHTCFSFSF